MATFESGPPSAAVLGATTPHQAGPDEWTHFRSVAAQTFTHLLTGTIDKYFVYMAVGLALMMASDMTARLNVAVLMGVMVAMFVAVWLVSTAAGLLARQHARPHIEQVPYFSLINTGQIARLLQEHNGFLEVLLAGFIVLVIFELFGNSLRHASQIDLTRLAHALFYLDAVFCMRVGLHLTDV